MKKNSALFYTKENLDSNLFYSVVAAILSLETLLEEQCFNATG